MKNGNVTRSSVSRSANRVDDTSVLKEVLRAKLRLVVLRHNATFEEKQTLNIPLNMEEGQR